MNIIDNILKTVNKKYFEYPIKDICVGIYLTYVEIIKVGVAFTLKGKYQIPHENPDIADVGYLIDKKFKEIFDFKNSKNPLERTLFISALNSILQDVYKEKLQFINPIEYLSNSFKNRKVAMIGFFPFAKDIYNWASDFNIIELNPSSKLEKTLKFDKIGKDYIKKCDLVISTGVTILNNSFDEIVKLNGSNFLIMLGPTVPFSDYLLKNGVDIISSLFSENDKLLKESLKQGAIVPKLLGCKMPVLSELKLQNNGYKYLDYIEYVRDYLDS